RGVVCRRVAVCLDHAYAVVGLQFLAARGARVAADYLAARDELSAQKARDHRLGHHADADEREPRAAQGVRGRSLWGKRRHAPIIFTRAPVRPSAGLRNLRPCVEMSRSGCSHPGSVPRRLNYNFLQQRKNFPPGFLLTCTLKSWFD